MFFTEFTNTSIMYKSDIYRRFVLFIACYYLALLTLEIWRVRHFHVTALLWPNFRVIYKISTAIVDHGCYILSQR